MGVIFDLDQTLIETKLASLLRKSGKWKEVYELVPSFVLYEGIISLLDELQAKNIPICIVTSSPSKYCNLVLKTHGIKIFQKVCYHDTTLRKPNADPILKAIELLEVAKKDIISIGDDPIDIIASKSAGVFSVGAVWGSLDSPALISENPDAICNNVSELRDLLRAKFPT